MRISGTSRLAIGSLALTLAVGCAQARPRRVASAEPPLLPSAEGEGDATVVEAPRARVVTFADRHPIVRRPREYYASTNGNKFGKTAAAAFIGVPSGIAAEMKQIVAGRAPAN